MTAMTGQDRFETMKKFCIDHPELRVFVFKYISQKLKPSELQDCLGDNINILMRKHFRHCPKRQCETCDKTLKQWCEQENTGEKEEIA